MRLTKVLWPIIIVCSALAALMVMRVFPGLPERPLFIMWFLFICPGMAFVRLLHLKELLVKLALALALSFSIDGIVVGVYLYAGHWSPFAIMLTLTVSSIAAVVIELTNVHVVVYNHVGFVRSFGALLTNPLIIGTSSAKPLPVASWDIAEVATVHMAQENSFAGAMPMDIEEKPTVQMAKAQFSSAATRNVDVEEKPTVQMAKTQLSSAAIRNADVEEMPTRQMEKAQLSPAVTRDVDVEEKPTVQMEKAQLSPAVTRDIDVEEKPAIQMEKAQLSSAARERFESQSTVQMPAQFSPAQMPQRATWSPSEPQTRPAERPHPEQKSKDADNKQNMHVAQNDDLHAMSTPATPQITHEDVDKTVTVSKPRSTTEDSFPEGDYLEKRAIRYAIDGALSEQADIDEPDPSTLSEDSTQKLSEDSTQKLSKDNVGIDVEQQLADGEEGRSGFSVANKPIRRKKPLATKFRRIENQ